VVHDRLDVELARRRPPAGSAADAQSDVRQPGHVDFGLGGLGDRAWLFVVGYLSIQIGRTAFAVWAFRGHRLYTHFANALVWEIGTGLIWIAGIAAEGDARLALWGAATAITYGGVIAGHPLPGRKSPFSSDSQIYAEHLLERFRLFFLIALGETVLTLGNAFASEPVQADRLLVLAIAHPHDPTTLAISALVFGGPAIFLLAQLGFMRRATGAVPRSRVIACLALLVLGLATAPLSLLAAVIASTAVLVGVAMADSQAKPEPANPQMVAS
jgi:low temperature requirement protein LtrA